MSHRLRLEHRPVDSHSGVPTGPSGDQWSHVVVVRPPPGTMEQLLLSAARGDAQALLALHSHMAGLVQLNVRRVLRDAARSDAVTQQVFADLPRDAIEFDPDRSSAQAWLLARAYQRTLDELGSAQPAPVSS